MGKIINVLDSSVYNHIAAGEVVERPASVIKELVENSIDAGSSRIDVEIENGGISRIKVSDNGIGIDKEYVKTAFLPHATSKIAKVDDLESILTLGFRGEALASISAVSKVLMVTKTQNQEIASAIEIEGGTILKEYETGRTTGTTTTISDLFFNVPARKKFLKKDKSEEQEVTALMSRFILANPCICFTYKADGKTIFSSPGTSLDDAIFSIYGKEAITQTIKVDFSRAGYKVSGVIGRPSYSKPNRTYQTLVINGRYVVNNTISVAITNAFGDMLMKRKYPFYVLHMSLPADEIDVNVHPNKLDVRFSNNSLVYSLFFEGVGRALSTMDYVALAEDKNIEKAIDKVQTSSILNTLKNIDTSESVTVQEPIKSRAYEYHSSSTINIIDTPTKEAVRPIIMPTTKNVEKIDKAGVNLNPFSRDIKSMTAEQKQDYKDTIIDATLSQTSSNSVKDGFGLGSKLLERLAEANDDDKYYSSNYPVTKQKPQQTDMGLNYTVKKIGKIFNTYLIVEVDDDVFFIDQHAAHERVLYEKFKAQYDKKDIAVQPLLFPYVLSLNPLEANIIEENLDTMNALGFEISEFGNNTYKVNGVPAIVSEMNFDTFFNEFLSDNKAISKKSSDLIRDYLMQHSCKSAIKGGNDLSENEINQLFNQMGKEKIALFCPHGRPIAIRISKSEIEKWFKRIV